MSTPDRIQQLATDMVQHWVDGCKICAIGGIVYRFPNGESLMNTTDAYACKSWLYQNGIMMRRVDAGGAPEWTFVMASAPEPSAKAH